MCFSRRAVRSFPTPTLASISSCPDALSMRLEIPPPRFGSSSIRQYSFSMTCASSFVSTDEMTDSIDGSMRSVVYPTDGISDASTDTPSGSTSDGSVIPSSVHTRTVCAPSGFGSRTRPSRFQFSGLNTTNDSPVPYAST